jgi:hypothetical protein
VFLNEEQFVPVPTDDERWYFDSGASNDMTGPKTLPTEIDESVRGMVKFGDGSAVEICGRGAVMFTCRNGEHRALTDVSNPPEQDSTNMPVSGARRGSMEMARQVWSLAFQSSA